MNKKARARIVTTIVFCIMLLFMVCFYHVNRPDSHSSYASDSAPVGFVSDDQYLCGLTDYCVKESKLYLLFGSKGVLKLYSEDGQYIGSYAYNKKKGQSALYIDQDNVYLFDEAFNCYVFNDVGFAGFIGYTDYSAYLSRINQCDSKEEQIRSDRGSYYIKGASVYRRSADKSAVLIISRPAVSVLFSGFTPYAILTMCMLMIILGVYYSRRKSN